MKRAIFALVIAVTAAFLTGTVPALAAPDYYQVADRYGYDLLTPEELDDLLAPIALYPDPLIAQILPAATFADDVVDAARFVRRFGTARVDYQPWDISVRAVAHYPQLLYRMERDYYWTIALGQAFIEQPRDVMDAIQRLRDYAWAQGNLYSTREQEVLYQAGAIRIIPARPQYIYLPVYDPYAVYVERYTPTYPFITFSIGFTIGAWLNRDCDWRDRRVYYHGWHGPRWVDRSRPHLRGRRDIYITPRASVINVNTRVVQRDTRSYREQLRSEGIRRREGGRVPQSRIRTEPPRPGRIERPRTPAQDQPRGVTVEPRTRTQQPPSVIHERTGQPPTGVRERSGTQQPPAVIQDRPRTRQPRPDTLEPGRPARQGQSVPGVTDQPRQGRSDQPGAGQQRRTGREGQGERRRELRQINRPPAPTTPQAPAVITPSPAAPQAPARGMQVPVQPRLEAPPVVAPPAAAPPTVITPAPVPRATPAPTHPATPSPRVTEPSQRQGRESQPEPRGRSEEQGRGRGTPREGR